MGDDQIVMEPEQVQEKASTHRKPRPKRRLLRVMTVGLLVCFLLGLGGTVAVVSLIGQRLNAPDWVRAEIENRIERNLGGAQIEFGGLQFVVNKGWRPRIGLRDVVLTDAQGAQVAELSDAEISLAMRPLFRGRIMPKRISVSGVLATLTRDQDGNVSLQLSDAAQPVGQGKDLTDMIESWDRVLLLPNFQALVDVDINNISLRYEDLGQNRGWTLDGGQILLQRDGHDVQLSSSFALLSGRAYASLFEANYSSGIGDVSAEFGVTVTDVAAEDIAAQNPAVAWLEVLRAPISGSMRGSVLPDGEFGAVSLTLQIGAGAVQPTQQSRPIRFDGARTYMTYLPGSQTLRFDEVWVDSEWISGTSEGHAFLSGVETGQLNQLVGQFKTNSLRINPDGLLPEPLETKQASFDFKLELSPFRFTLGEATITDVAGQIDLTGELTADQNGWHLALDGAMDQLNRNRLLQFWPEQAAPKPRIWVEENIWAGAFSDIDFALRLEPGDRPFVSVDWSFDDTTVQFNKFQPPITGASGEASILGDRLSVTATKGVITPDEGGDIDVTGTSFMIPDMSVKPFTYGIVRAQATASVTSVLSLLNRPPLSVLKDTPLPVDLADGTVSFAGNLSVPLRPKVPYNEIQFNLDGTITDVSSTILVPGFSVASGNLHLQADQSEVVISGPGDIAGLPANVSWRQPLGKAFEGQGSRVQGTVELSQRAIDTFNIGLPDGSVSGVGQADVSVDLKPGVSPVLTLTSDLRGVGLSIPPLGWSKPASTSGTLELTATLGKNVRVDKVRLRASGLDADGTVTTTTSGNLDRASFSHVRLGQWLDAQVDLIGRGGAEPTVQIVGGKIDLSQRPSGGGSGAGGSASGTTPLDVTLSEVKITDSLRLTAFKGTFTSNNSGLAGTFTGRVNGQTAVNGRLVPQNGGSAIEVTSDDGGGVFRSAGIIEQAHGGPFTLKMIPQSGEGHYSGSLRVTNTRVKDASVIIGMLNAVSVVGLVDEMAGQGILFTEVDAKFDLSPDKLTLISSSAVGASIGLSMDGSVDLKTNRLGLRGVISPLYLINVLGSVLTRKGEGLIGFNFTLTGPAGAPHIQVNPLSGLAPGMFREIFRGQSAPDPGKDIPVTGSGALQTHDPSVGIDR